jgi:hypothetical protein
VHNTGFPQTRRRSTTLGRRFREGDIGWGSVVYLIESRASDVDRRETAQIGSRKRSKMPLANTLLTVR